MVNFENSSATLNLDDFDFKGTLLTWKERTREILQSMIQEEGFNDVKEDSSIIAEIDNSIDHIRNLTDITFSDFEKYKTSSIETRRLEDEINSLSERIKQLENTLEELTEEENKSRKAFKKQNVAFEKAISTYSKNLDLDITIQNESDTTYKAFIRFASQNSMAPIKIVVDRNLREIIEFDTKEVLTQETEIELKEKFGDLSNNIPQLLCRIREFILKFS